MFDALKRYTQAIAGFAEVSRRGAEQIANALAKQGLVSGDQARSLAQEVVRRSQENRERLLDLVRRELPRLGVATRADLERLKQRVQAVEASQRAAAKTGAPRRPAKRATPRKRGSGSAGRA